jgi:hypothetical protein
MGETISGERDTKGEGIVRHRSHGVRSERRKGSGRARGRAIGEGMRRDKSIGDALSGFIRRVGNKDGHGSEHDASGECERRVVSILRTRKKFRQGGGKKR